MKILAKMPISPYSGYGRDGIGMIHALMKAGHDVYLQPTHIDAPIPQDIANLFTKRLSAPFDLGIVHVDPGQLELTEGMRQGCETVIGWTMWEYSTLDNLNSRRTLKKRLRKFDALLAYDQVTKNAFDPYYSGPMPIVQGGYDPEEWPYFERDWHSDRLSFIMVGQLHDRKNPFAAVQAFQELKQEYPQEFDGAELHLKTNVPGLHPAMNCECPKGTRWDEHTCPYPKLRIHYDTWSDEVLKEFYKSAHVLLAPSRGEGKNMPALEFQTTGGAVIATNWGGHQQWLSSEYAYPLAYDLRPIDGSPKHAKCMNANASVPHLKELMLDAYRDRDTLKAKAYKASQVIPEMCSWDNVIERMFLALRNSLPKRGNQLWAAHRMA